MFARYSVLRLMIFFGFLLALWLLGLREVSERWWLLGLSAAGSMVVSFFVLRGPRAELSASIANRVDERARRAERAGRDETAEDAEDARGAQDAQGAKGAEKPQDAENPQDNRRTSAG